MNYNELETKLKELRVDRTEGLSPFVPFSPPAIDESSEADVKDRRTLIRVEDRIGSTNL